MWKEWVRREMHRGVCSGRLMERTHCENLEADERVRGK
jgi:hypothetical protein